LGEDAQAGARLDATLSTANSPRSADFAIFVLPHIEGANLGIATTAICSQ